MLPLVRMATSRDGLLAPPTPLSRMMEEFMGLAFTMMKAALASAQSSS